MLSGKPVLAVLMSFINALYTVHKKSSVTVKRCSNCIFGNKITSEVRGLKPKSVILHYLWQLPPLSPHTMPVNDNIGTFNIRRAFENGFRTFKVIKFTWKDSLTTCQHTDKLRSQTVGIRRSVCKFIYFLGYEPRFTQGPWFLQFHFTANFHLPCVFVLKSKPANENTINYIKCTEHVQLHI